MAKIYESITELIPQMTTFRKHKTYLWINLIKLVGLKQLFKFHNILLFNYQNKSFIHQEITLTNQENKRLCLQRYIIFLIRLHVRTLIRIFAAYH